MLRGYSTFLARVPVTEILFRTKLFFCLVDSALCNWYRVSGPLLPPLRDMNIGPSLWFSDTMRMVINDSVIGKARCQSKALWLLINRMLIAG